MDLVFFFSAFIMGTVADAFLMIFMLLRQYSFFINNNYKYLYIFHFILFCFSGIWGSYT